MELNLSVQNQSIEATGITKDYREAICEYIWNGLEANATIVEISTALNIAGGVDELFITDNGDGIHYDRLSNTFGSFMASQKAGLSLQLKSKANKGNGRFAFSSFAAEAIWHTVYNNKQGTFGYEITLDNINKNKYTVSDCVPVDAPTGTVVSFGGIDDILGVDITIESLEPVLLKTFAWYLYLNKNKQVIINGQALDYTKYINETMSASKVVVIGRDTFDIDLVVWADKIKENFSVYYLDYAHKPCGKDTTFNNRNTMSFAHSVLIRSTYFNEQTVDSLTDTQMDDYGQIALTSQNEGAKILARLKKEVQALISAQMRSFALAQADKAIGNMHDRKSFPTFGEDPYSLYRKQDLETVTKELYCLEPKLFYKLNPQQEKSFLGLLNLLLSSEQRENILEIMETIVDVTPEQRLQLADILKRSKLETMRSTMRLVEDRYAVMEALKEIIHDTQGYANQQDRLREIMEHQYWLFGEQYHLVIADQEMQKALAQDAQHEMDTFLCGARKWEDEFAAQVQEHLIVEIKAPEVILSKTVVRQMEDDMDFIRKQPAFQSQIRSWKFIAVCASVDEDVKSRFEANQAKGKKGLVTAIENYEIYALTWDDIMRGFEMSHGYLLEQLKVNRDAMANKLFI